MLSDNGRQQQYVITFLNTPYQITSKLKKKLKKKSHVLLIFIGYQTSVTVASNRCLVI